jgi:hypothetical protein
MPDIERCLPQFVEALISHDLEDVRLFRERDFTPEELNQFSSSTR